MCCSFVCSMVAFFYNANPIMSNWQQFRGFFNYLHWEKIWNTGNWIKLSWRVYTSEMLQGDRFLRKLWNRGRNSSYSLKWALLFFCNVQMFVLSCVSTYSYVSSIYSEKIEISLLFSKILVMEYFIKCMFDWVFFWLVLPKNVCIEYLLEYLFFGV